MTARLYCFGESGNAYKVALMLTLTRTPWEPIFVDFFSGEARKPEFLAINSMGEVPVLQIDDRILAQSGMILQYLARSTGQFGGDDQAERDEILRWILWDNHKFSTQTGLVRFLSNFIPEEKRSEPVIAFLKARLNTAYGTLEHRLSESEWLVGAKPSIADFSACSYLYYPEPFGFDRAAWPAIDAWLDRIAALDGWKHPYDLMPGSPADRGLHFG